MSCHAMTLVVVSALAEKTVKMPATEFQDRPKLRHEKRHATSTHVPLGSRRR